MSRTDRTKYDFARTMKVLMQRKPLEKIHIAEICADCQIHRQSFYYHFDDKYSLLNWIFNHEVFLPMEESDYQDFYDALCDLAHRLYADAEFYRSAFKAEPFGSSAVNGFQRNFMEKVRVLIRRYYMKDFAAATNVTAQDQENYYMDCLSAAVMANFQGWLLEYSQMDSHAYCELILTTRPF